MPEQHTTRSKQTMIGEVQNRITGHGDEAPDQLLANPLNFRRHPSHQMDALRGSIRELGWVKTVLVNKRTGYVIDGHARVEEAVRQKLATVPVTYVDLSPEEERLALAVLDPITEIAIRDQDALSELLADVTAEDAGLQAFLATLGQEQSTEDAGEGGAGSLSAKFGVPPLSVLNAREGWWQERKRGWLSLGIESEVGRAENLLGYSKTILAAQGETGGTSIFDPVLCELAYRWFCPPGGTVLDPFAGGSVRGVVAAKLGRQYVGVDLRAEQVVANRSQAEAMALEPAPVWHVADSATIPLFAGDLRADFLFSCPPYADLEVYSKDARDLSNMEYEDFLGAYQAIILAACGQLLPNRFACFVVGEVRGPSGAYRNFVGDTVESFRAAGLEFYNEAILVTPIGSLAMRAGRTFQAGRKMGKTHQNVLIFVKGDAKAATQAVGLVDFGEAEAGSTDYGPETHKEAE